MIDIDMMYNFILRFIEEFLKLYNELAIFLLFGFALAGLVKVIFSATFIVKYLGNKNFKSVVLASIAGVPLPLCSCGVIPTAVSLKKQGATKGAVVSFLTSTPQTGIDSFMVTYSFLGLLLTVYKVGIALITGIIGGIICNLFEKDDTENKNIYKVTTIEDSRSKINNIKEYLSYSFIELLDSLKIWLILGLIIATLISIFVPNNLGDMLSQNKYSSYFGYLLVLLIATPMYICATSSVPIAAQLIAKGLSAGTAIVFLIAGPATNAATLTVLFKELGKKATIIYLINIIIASFIFGIVFDKVFPNYRIAMLADHVGTHQHMSVYRLWLHYLSSVILGILIIFLFTKNYVVKFINFIKKNLIQKSNNHNISTIYLEIGNISCMGCVKKIENSLDQIKGIHTYTIDLTGSCTLEICDYCAKQSKNELIIDIQNQISKLGYTNKLKSTSSL